VLHGFPGGHALEQHTTLFTICPCQSLQPSVLLTDITSVWVVHACVTDESSSPVVHGDNSVHRILAMTGIMDNQRAPQAINLPFKREQKGGRNRINIPLQLSLPTTGVDG